MSEKTPPEKKPPGAAASPARDFLLRLYPPAWRHRYGGELSALLADQPLTFAVVMDLVGGALDAWLSPQKTVIEAGARTMNAHTTLLACSNRQPKISVRESLTSAAAILLVTLAMTTAHYFLKKAYGPTPAIEAILASTFSVNLLMTCSALYIQHRSWRAQFAFVGVFGSVIYLIFLAAAGFNAG